MLRGLDRNKKPELPTLDIARANLEAACQAQRDLNDTVERLASRRRQALLILDGTDDLDGLQDRLDGWDQEVSKAEALRSAGEAKVKDAFDVWYAVAKVEHQRRIAEAKAEAAELTAQMDALGDTLRAARRRVNMVSYKLSDADTYRDMVVKNPTAFAVRQVSLDI